MALAQTLTGLIPTLYAARDIVARELVGFIPAVARDARASRAAKDQVIRVPIVGAYTASDITPAMTPPTPNGPARSYVDMSITKQRAIQVPWNGDEQLSLGGAGPGVNVIMRDDFAQAMRTLCNEIEADLALLYKSASRAYGTAGTTPFASTVGDAAQMRKILDDNGCPKGDRQLVISTSSGANLRSLGNLTKANEAATDDVLRRGVLIDLSEFSIRESAQVVDHTKGTGASYAVNNGAGYAVGSTTIAVDTGTGTIVAGDIFTNTQASRDANKYVVGTALSGGSLAVNNPGIRKAWVDNDTVAVGNNYSANLAFHRSALVLLARTPALPGANPDTGQGGRDMATDRMQLADPVSGLVFDIAEYAGYHQMFYEVGIAWGVKATKPEFIATLLG